MFKPRLKLNLYFCGQEDCPQTMMSITTTTTTTHAGQFMIVQYSFHPDIHLLGSIGTKFTHDLKINPLLIKLTSFSAVGSDTHENVMSHCATTSAGLFPFRAPSFTNSRHCKDKKLHACNSCMQKVHSRFSCIDQRAVFF